MHARFRGGLAALLALVLATLLAGCESLQGLFQAAPKPTARVVEVSIQNLTLSKVDLVFAIEVTNPYSTSFPLVDLSYVISSGGHEILRGEVRPNGSIPARGSQVIQLPAIVAFASVAKAVKGLRPGSVVPYQADLTLAVDAPMLGRVMLPLSKSGEIPVPAAPEVELASFHISTLSLDRVQASARLRVKNTNSFALDVSRLDLELALGGSNVGRSSLKNAARLPPGGTGMLEVPLSFSPRAFGLGLVNLLRGDKAGYALSGSLEAGSPYGAIALPFSRNGNTPISR
ncbi:MAG TPA: LEA type 2 family protein [Burkholderiales bacterium]|nr:LEA type 2 family protein [Burkholderiales bacterium]